MKFLQSLFALFRRKPKASKSSGPKPPQHINCRCVQLPEYLRKHQAAQDAGHFR